MIAFANMIKSMSRADADDPSTTNAIQARRESWGSELALLIRVTDPGVICFPWGVA